MSEPDLDDLAAELADFAPPEQRGGRPASEERVIAGFEEIQRFVDKHGRVPQHGEDRDIFERLYAVRLDRLRALADCRALLEPLDHHGLLDGAATVAALAVEAIDLDELAAALADGADADDITVLRHVRTSADKRAAEEIADRKPCEDFDAFKPLFDQVRSDLGSGLRVTRPFGQYATIEVGHWFILDGQTAYVADEGEDFDSPQGKKDARLRVIFSNGTESNLLRLSLARALYKNPRVLALDEATSHLDIANERRVTQTLAAMPLTRIIVAHRPETIAGAQRVVALSGGSAVDQPPRLAA